MRAMLIHFICVGTRMPGWVQQGYEEYARRLPRECSLCLHEIPLGRRGKGADVQRAVREEGERMLAALPRDCHVLALDQRGGTWSTEQLAGQLQGWLSGRPGSGAAGGRARWAGAVLPGTGATGFGPCRR